MLNVTQRVQSYYQEQRPTGALLDEENAKGLLLMAIRKYAAYGELEVHEAQRIEYLAALALDPFLMPPIYAPFDDQMPIGDSDWGVIEPLWQLYMEKERALMVEATRMMGDVAHGRMSSEVQQDINLYEGEMHMKAFSYPVVSVA